MRTIITLVFLAMHFYPLSAIAQNQMKTTKFSPSGCSRFMPLFAKYGQRFNVPAFLLLSIAESNGNTCPDNVVSPRFRYLGYFSYHEEQCLTEFMGVHSDIGSKCSNYYNAEMNTALTAKLLEDALQVINRRCGKLPRPLTAFLTYAFYFSGQDVLDYLILESCPANIEAANDRLINYYVNRQHSSRSKALNISNLAFQVAFAYARYERAAAVTRK